MTPLPGFLLEVQLMDQQVNQGFLKKRLKIIKSICLTW
jgi:hypothetical protein